MRMGERWHAPTARRLLIECIAVLDELGLDGGAIRDISGDAAIIGEPVPEFVQRWLRLRVSAHGAYAQASRMRRDSMPRLRRELDQIRAEAYLLFLAESPEVPELRLGVDARRGDDQPGR